MTELKTIDLIAEKFELKASSKGFGPFGDDSVVTPSAGPGEVLVSSSDSFVEAVHFEKTMGMFSVGWKSLVSALSDIFAMGATPTYYMLNLIIPPGLTDAEFETFLEGQLKAAKTYNVNLVGGDVSSGPCFCIVIQACGYQNKSLVKSNSGFSKGDVILTDAHLGHALLGYKEFLKGRTDSIYLKRFLFPELSKTLGPWLGGLKEVTSITDISDGLYKELSNMCRMKSLKVLLESVNFDSDFDRTCKGLSLEPLRVALEGGEEYELLWTVKPENLTNFLTKYQMKHKKTAQVLGRIGGALPNEFKNGVFYENQDLIESIKPFEHFTS
jgi:thiamine-monophosphate kinase